MYQIPSERAAYTPQSRPLRPQHRLPGPLPIGFPEIFAQRLQALAQDPQNSEHLLEQLYFDLVISPRRSALLQRCYKANDISYLATATDSVFLDPSFSWCQHLDTRLNRRWNECRQYHPASAQIEATLAQLIQLRSIAAHHLH